MTKSLDFNPSGPDGWLAVCETDVGGESETTSARWYETGWDCCNKTADPYIISGECWNTAVGSDFAWDITSQCCNDPGATITASTIAFVDSNPDTITDSGNGFLTAGFEADDPITVTGSVSNNGSFTIATVTAGTITLIGGDSLTAESAGPTVTIISLDTCVKGAMTCSDGDCEGI